MSNILDQQQLFKKTPNKKIKKCYHSALTAILRPAVDSVGCPESESMFGFPGRGRNLADDTSNIRSVTLTFSIMYNLIKQNKTSKIFNYIHTKNNFDDKQHLE